MLLALQRQARVGGEECEHGYEQVVEHVNRNVDVEMHDFTTIGLEMIVHIPPSFLGMMSKTYKDMWLQWIKVLFAYADVVAYLFFKTLGYLAPNHFDQIPGSLLSTVSIEMIPSPGPYSVGFNFPRTTVPNIKNIPLERKKLSNPTIAETGEL